MENSTIRDWTPEDTVICNKAEASGRSFNLITGKPTTLAELIEFRNEYQKVKETVSFDEFIKGKLGSIPFT